jgi:DNA-binding MarR family transcriptional regulator
VSDRPTTFLRRVDVGLSANVEILGLPYSLDSSLLHALHRATQTANDIFIRESPFGDLTPRQLVVLAAIAESEGQNQTHLVERTGVDRSTIADIVQRLHRKALLTRRRTKADNRAYAVKLTDEGRTVLREAEAVALRTEEILLSALTSRQRQEALKLLNVLAASPGAVNPTT